MKDNNGAIDAYASSVRHLSQQPSGGGIASAYQLLEAHLSANATCTPPDSFVFIDFDGASVARSNLGGQGGRCTDYSQCDEIYDAPTTPHEIILKDVGINVMSARYHPSGIASSGEPVDLRITNTTEYHGWNTPLNGIKRKTGERYGACT